MRLYNRGLTKDRNYVISAPPSDDWKPMFYEVMEKGFAAVPATVLAQYPAEQPASDFDLQRPYSEMSGDLPSLSVKTTDGSLYKVKLKSCS